MKKKKLGKGQQSPGQQGVPLQAVLGSNLLQVTKLQYQVTF